MNQNSGCLYISTLGQIRSSLLKWSDYTCLLHFVLHCEVPFQCGYWMYFWMKLNHSLCFRSNFRQSASTTNRYAVNGTSWKLVTSKICGEYTGDLGSQHQLFYSMDPLLMQFITLKFYSCCEIFVDQHLIANPNFGFELHLWVFLEFVSISWTH